MRRVVIFLCLMMAIESAIAGPRHHRHPHRKPRPVQSYIYRSQDRECPAYKSKTDVPQPGTITVVVPKAKERKK